MKQVKIILAIVLVVLGLIIVLQNTASVETELLFVKVTMPKAVLLFITLAIGFASGIMASMFFARRMAARDKKS
ncbi:MAG: LapA family protein [Planctomycetota bacterium]